MATFKFNNNGIEAIDGQAVEKKLDDVAVATRDGAVNFHQGPQTIEAAVQNTTTPSLDINDPSVL